MPKEQAKAIIEKLVERFAEHLKEYHLADYNEQKAEELQTRIEQVKQPIEHNEDKINQLVY